MSSSSTTTSNASIFFRLTEGVHSFFHQGSSAPPPPTASTSSSTSAELIDQVDYFNQLPRDLQGFIFSFLPPSHLASANQICRSFVDFPNDPIVYLLYKNMIFDPQACFLAEGESWRDWVLSHVKERKLYYPQGEESRIAFETTFSRSPRMYQSIKTFNVVWYNPAENQYWSDYKTSDSAFGEAYLLQTVWWLLLNTQIKLPIRDNDTSYKISFRLGIATPESGRESRLGGPRLSVIPIEGDEWKVTAAIRESVSDHELNHLLSEPHADIFGQRKETSIEEKKEEKKEEVQEDEHMNSTASASDVDTASAANMNLTRAGGPSHPLRLRMRHHHRIIGKGKGEPSYGMRECEIGKVIVNGRLGSSKMISSSSSNPIGISASRNEGKKEEETSSVASLDYVTLNVEMNKTSNENSKHEVVFDGLVIERLDF